MLVDEGVDEGDEDDEVVVVSGTLLVLVLVVSATVLVVGSGVSSPPVTLYAAAHSVRSMESGQHQVCRAVSCVQ